MPSEKKVNQPYFIDMVTQEVFYLQTIPIELEKSGETSWSTIQATGRNVPLYQYTGAEDVVNFTVSWYANEDNKEDALKKCKWLDALSQNDGYDNKPHKVKFIFGRLFCNSIWIVASAKYKMSLFDRSKEMMPCLAIQEISLKRVSETNPTRSEILNIET